MSINALLGEVNQLKTREELVAVQIGARDRLRALDRGMASSYFQGQAVEFDDKKLGVVQCTVDRVNTKSISVSPTDKHCPGWRVPASMLRPSSLSETDPVK